MRLWAPRPAPSSTSSSLLTDGVHAVREEQSAGAAASGGRGGLGPGVSSTYNDHVEVRSPRRHAVAAEPGQRKALFAERGGDPAAAASEGEHASRKPRNLTPASGGLGEKKPTGRSHLAVMSRRNTSTSSVATDWRLGVTLASQGSRPTAQGILSLSCGASWPHNEAS
jgi:hypothetical protein